MGWRVLTSQLHMLLTATQDWLWLLQIQTSRQRAINILHAYPYVAHKDRIVSVLAEQHGEPSVTSLLSDTSKTDLQHSADWQRVVDYLSSISLANMHIHQPLVGQQ